MERLFEIDSIPDNPDYCSPSEKQKWSSAFESHCRKEWKTNGNKTGIFSCGCMNICSYCEGENANGCKDCVKTIKKVLKMNNIKIDCKNFDFDKYIRMAEEVCS